MSIPYNTLKSTDTVVTHVLDDGNAIVSLCTSRMETSFAVKLITPERIILNPQYATDLLQSGAVNAQRVKTISQIFVSRVNPILLARFPNGSDALLDGQHRYCAAVFNGEKEILGRRLPPSVWQQFIVSGIPWTDQQLHDLVSKYRKGSTRSLN